MLVQISPSFKPSEYYSPSLSTFSNTLKPLIVANTINLILQNTSQLVCPENLCSNVKPLFEQLCFLEKLLMPTIQKQNITPDSFIELKYLMHTFDLSECQDFESLFNSLTTKLDYGSFFGALTSYVDVNCSCSNFLTSDFYRLFTSLHVARHLYTYSYVKSKSAFDLFGFECSKNNSKPDKLEYKDSGWSKTRILILTSTRFFAKMWLETINSIISPDNDLQQSLLEYSSLLDDDQVDILDEVGLRLFNDKILNKKPLSYIYNFRGNNDDSFILPVCLRQSKLVVSSKLTNADIIIASPLGLRFALKNCKPDDADDNESEFQSKKKRSHDYDLLTLSSLEILVLDNVDMLIDQNVKHLLKIIELCNKRPAIPGRNFNVGRLRPCFFSEDPMEDSTRLRQTIILSDGRQSVLETLKFNNQRGFINFWKQSTGFVLDFLRNFSDYRNYLIKTNLTKKVDLPSSLNYLEHDKPLLYFYDLFVNSLYSRNSSSCYIIVVPSQLELFPVSHMLKVSFSSINMFKISEETHSSQIKNIYEDFKKSSYSVLLITERCFRYYPIKFKQKANLVFVHIPKSIYSFLLIVNDMKNTTSDDINISSWLNLLYYYEKTDIWSLERILGKKNLGFITRKLNDTNTISL